MYFTYVSPEGSTTYTDIHERNGILLLENNLNEVQNAYPDCYYFLAGDMNARTKTFLDYIPCDNLDHIFGETDYAGDEFDMPRNTKDSITYNQFGKSLVELCCTFNMHMLNGRVHDDTDGNFTCIANKWCEPGRL